MAPYREEVRERFASPPYGAVRHCASATLVLFSLPVQIGEAHVTGTGIRVLPYGGKGCEERGWKAGQSGRKS